MALSETSTSPHKAPTIFRPDDGGIEDTVAVVVNVVVVDIVYVIVVVGGGGVSPGLFR